MKSTAKDNITTKEDFELFKAECGNWINHWGLLSWLFEFYHISDKSGGNRAWLVTNDTNRLACIHLNVHFGSTPISEENIRLAAFHEVDEVRYNGIREKMNLYFAYDIVDCEIHKLITQDENCIFPYIEFE